MSNTSKLDKFFYHNILQNNKIQEESSKKDINPDFTPWNKRNLHIEVTPVLKTIQFKDTVSKYLHSSDLEFTNKNLDSGTFTDIIDILCKWHMTQNLKEDMFQMFMELLTKFRPEQKTDLKEIQTEFNILWEHWKQEKYN